MASVGYSFTGLGLSISGRSLSPVISGRCGLRAGRFVVGWMIVGSTLSSFVLKGGNVCNVLRVVVLIVSLFLMVDVSMSAFGKVPFCARSSCVGARL